MWLFTRDFYQETIFFNERFVCFGCLLFQGISQFWRATEDGLSNVGGRLLDSNREKSGTARKMLTVKCFSIVSDVSVWIHSSVNIPNGTLKPRVSLPEIRKAWHKQCSELLALYRSGFKSSRTLQFTRIKSTNPSNYKDLNRWTHYTDQMDINKAKSIVLATLFVVTIISCLLPLKLISTIRNVGDPVRKHR